MGNETPSRNLVIVRFAPEVSTKSNRTRRRFHRVLRANVADALDRAEVPHRLTLNFSRLLIETDAVPEALGVLPRVFGVGSYSRVEAVSDATVDAIAATGGVCFAERTRGRRYAVRCKKIGRHDFSSMEVERTLGRALNEGAKVDLVDPEVTVHVECHEGIAYFFTEKCPGIGGLPGGVQGRAVALISGGFDSAVAAWHMMKRGVVMDFVFCNLGGSAYERMVLQVAKVLHDAWNFGQRPRFYVVDFTGPVADLRSKVTPSYWQVVLKRLMYRAADRIAMDIGAEALVTGEAVGQVSSQTLSNLLSIDGAATLPVLRPLVGTDKRDIVDQARRIGTAPLSARIREYCAIASQRPVTAANRTRVEREDARLDPAALDSALANRREIDLHAVTADDLRMPYIFTEIIPNDAIVIDCQQPHMYESWHVPGALHRDPVALLDGFRRELDRDRTYVLYCSFGVQTPMLAEVMQQAGYEAYAFRGGLSVIRRHVEENPRRGRAAA